MSTAETQRRGEGKEICRALRVGRSRTLFIGLARGGGRGNLRLARCELGAMIGHGISRRLGVSAVNYV